MQTDIKQREMTTLAQCDSLIKGGQGAKASAGGMNDAVNSTEAIRTWKEHLMQPEDLAKKLDSDAAKGLS